MPKSSSWKRLIFPLWYSGKLTVTACERDVSTTLLIYSERSFVWCWIVAWGIRHSGTVSELTNHERTEWPSHGLQTHETYFESKQSFINWHFAGSRQLNIAFRDAKVNWAYPKLQPSRLYYVTDKLTAAARLLSERTCVVKRMAFGAINHAGLPVATLFKRYLTGNEWKIPL